MPTQALNKHARDEIHRRTLAAVRADLGDTDAALLIGHCLEFAWQGYQILKTWPGAPRTIIQAGSARWCRIPPHLDDGVSPTHFSYEWDPGSEIARLFRSGVVPVVRRADGVTASSLPEMHVWLGCPETGELIDFTAGLWPAACLATLGADWLALSPPEYLWTLGSRCPEGANYEASRDAIDCVIAVLRRQGRQYP